MPDEWISIADAVKRFGIPERTLRGHLERGKLKGERRGRSWFICVSEPVINNNHSNINQLPPPPIKPIVTKKTGQNTGFKT